MRIVLAGLLALAACMAPTASAFVGEYGDPVSCVTAPLLYEGFCQVTVTVEDLDGRDYGASAGTPGYTYFCVDPACTPGVPICFAASYWLGNGEQEVLWDCVQLPVAP